MIFQNGTTKMRRKRCFGDYSSVSSTSGKASRVMQVVHSGASKAMRHSVPVISYASKAMQSVNHNEDASKAMPVKVYALRCFESEACRIVHAHRKR